MLFSSLVFLFTFLPITLLVYYLVPRKVKNVVLLIASLIFYAWGEPVYIFLMLISILFNYFCGMDIALKAGRKSQVRSLIFTIVVNLFILGFFKYYGFIVTNLNAILPFYIPYRKLELPIGISFYTFQTLSYIIDVYRGNVDVQVNLIDFGTYVTMFPQLIAGPIVQYADVERQLRERKESLTKFGYGAWFFVIGLAKKVLLANTIGSIYENIAAMDGMSVVTAWLGCLAYTFQIYFDFSGYSDMAVGLGKMFGFEFMQNFNYPYISKSVTEFWRRWHISLGSWFREYVYIPLGGNRKGFVKQCRNILIVFLLSGFWHGASWNFVVWGLIHGIYMVGAICLSQIRKDKKRILHPVAGWILTLLLVNIAWVFFRAPSLIGAWRILQQPFVNPLGSGIAETMSFLGIRGFAILRLLTTGISWLILERLPEEIDKNCQTQKGFCMAAVIFVVMVTVIEFSWLGRMASGGENAFIYFRF